MCDVEITAAAGGQSAVFTHTDATRLHELFEQQADLQPDGCAIASRDRELSYRDAEDQANQLAHLLRSLGIGRGDLVGLYCRRSPIAVISILGILKAGAAYVPLDEAWPEDRIEGILADANVRLLITDQTLAPRAENCFHGTTVVVDSPDQQADLRSRPSTRTHRSETTVSPNDLCYIIYTSGTTGRPKGIMTEHRNAVAFTRSFNTVCQLTRSDRVYQGFSLSFDGSVEEIWMAFSTGATLVIGPPEYARLGDETAQFMADQGVTFFSTVPTFLAMLRAEVPSLQVIVVSGEPCPPELVTTWVRPGRRMLNVYGPTETTVNTTVWECLPETPISIGRPLPGYDTYVLDENLTAVRPGEPGELYIGGVGVARGYLHQPALTETSFVPNPFETNGSKTRLYRTGDRVREADNGELLFLGRIDGQVKVRGYRIELGEIESVLREHPEIEAAAVTVMDRDGLQELAAFVVPASNSVEPLDRSNVLDLLRKRLPSYMVPAYFDPIDELPRLTSGKVDRKSLPDPQTPLVGTNRKIVAPRNELEQTLVEVWEKIFETSPISVEDDFFLDLGGYSLLATAFVSVLRGEHGIEVSMREAYEHSTVAKLAAHIASSVQQDAVPKPQPERVQPRSATQQAFQSVSLLQRLTCVGLQFVSSIVLYGLISWPIALSGIVTLSLWQGTVSIAVGVGILATLLLGWYPLNLVISITAKWLCIGRYKAGSYPLWGWYFFRFWLATKFQALSGIGFLSGTPVMSLYFRLMGAKIGRGCIVDTPFCTAFDLVTIGDETCIGSETHLLGYRIEDGMLHFGTVEIGHRCFVGIHSALGLDTRMGSDARLGDLSLLPDKGVIGDNQSWRGSPAQPGSVPLMEPDNHRPQKRHPFFFGLLHMLLAELLIFVLFLSVVPVALMEVAASVYGGAGWAVAAFLLSIPMAVVSFCLLVAGLKAIVMRRTDPGVYSVESWFYLRKWFVDALMAATRVYMHPLYTTIYLPPWLRMLGARIGRRAEISTISQMTPDLVEIDDESFFADGSMIGGRHFYRGHVEFARNRIGRRSFVGNNAILSIGSQLGEGCLLGVLSVPPDDRQATPDGTEWLGSPSFSLPFRRKVEGFGASVTFDPTIRLYVQRLLIDAFRILAPFFILNLGAIAFSLFVVAGWSTLPVWLFCLLTPVAFSATAIATSLCVVALKRLIMGSFRPVVKPLWCQYVWWNEVINGAYETVGAPVLSPLQGTPAFNLYLRLMGCKVGKWAYVGTTLFSEFDLVDIGDHAILNPGVVVQNHLFEDRIMKSSHLKIGDECSVGNLAVILYDTEMKQGASVGPLSLLMKGETLPAHSRWRGIPTSRVED